RAQPSGRMRPSASSGVPPMRCRTEMSISGSLAMGPRAGALVGIALSCMYLHYMYIHITMAGRKQASGRTLVADARAVVRACAGLNIRLAARRITRFLDAQMQETGLSIAQFGLLTHIAAAGDDTIGALAERAGLDQSTLSRNLRGLERDGLIEIAIVEKDLRRRAVWLTEAGARSLDAAIPAWRRAHEALSAVVAPRDIRRIATNAAALADVTDGVTSARL